MRSFVFCLALLVLSSQVSITKEKSDSERLTYLTKAVAIPDDIKEELSKKTRQLLADHDMTWKHGGVNPLNWVSFVSEKHVLLLSRKDFEIAGNRSLRVDRPICQSHLQAVPGAKFVSTTSDVVLKDPVLSEGNAICSKIGFKVLLQYARTDKNLSDCAPELSFVLVSADIIQ